MHQCVSSLYRWTGRLSRLDEQELFDLSPLPFGSFCLLLLDLVVKLELLFSLCRLTSPVISHSQAIVCVGKVRIHFDCLRVEADRLVKGTLRCRDNSELQVSLTALRIDRD